jgi:hypothetical protein
MMKLSPLFRDPTLQAVFASAEGQRSPAVAVPNPLVSPALRRAVERLQPCPRARQLMALINTARVGEAAALAEQMIIDADT